MCRARSSSGVDAAAGLGAPLIKLASDRVMVKLRSFRHATKVFAVGEGGFTRPRVDDSKSSGNEFWLILIELIEMA